MLRVRWKDFELPTRVTIDEPTLTHTYGKFIIEPFEQGFGVTIGNGLRRVLYSSIEGTSITAVKIKGVSHQFTTIDGVLEDVVDIMLNFKQIVIRFNGDFETKTLKLKVDKKGEVRAEHIAPEIGVEIVNPELKIATLQENVEFEADLIVRRGRRYVTSEENQKELSEAGFVPLDSNFSPVKRAKYSVEATRVGRRTNYDRLVLEVWTNGSVTPEEGLAEAAKILRKHLNPFVQFFELGRELQVSEKREEEIRMRETRLEGLRTKLAMSISELDLGVRAYNCLESEKIETIGDLVTKGDTELLKLKNFGKTSLKEVKKKLAEQGLSLGMSLDEIFGRRPVS
ncbi:MAG TPA: DNA-directed RNA polymerase subunit alpha [Planctomycetota bacterium]|nr:DNA-directed RNA polymerase subunit alpha [Planctomycetota bacterium]